MSDLIDRDEAIDFIDAGRLCNPNEPRWSDNEVVNFLKSRPSAQPEIIRCNVCRHWHQTTGEMKGFGLGDCDYLEKKLVTCNGYCYWAERKGDE